MRNNRKFNKTDPPITVRTYKSIRKANSVNVKDGKFVYSPNKPLSCGARLWFETQEEVQIND
jgi:hypothetical protein